MNKASDWKTPLGYYEKAIAELRRTREEVQTELQTLKQTVKELQSSQESLRSELESTKAELQATKTKLEARQAEIQNQNESFDNLLKEAQDLVNITRIEIKSVKVGIENGSIVAQKALMLRGKDDEYWMRFSKLDSVNHHCFQVWRSDNTWHDDIRVKAATFLRARDEYHWMGFRYVDNKNYDVYSVWKWDNTWQSTVRVRAARYLLKRLKNKKQSLAFLASWRFVKTINLTIQISLLVLLSCVTLNFKQHTAKLNTCLYSPRFKHHVPGKRLRFKRGARRCYLSSW